MAKSKQKLRQAANGRPIEQVAALPFRLGEDGDIQILIMTSRETQRAVIPKGWPMKNRKDWKSAEIEARQEAGVVGDVGRKRIGEYHYWKRLETHFALARVAVYPLAVRRQLDDWPERHERAQIWVTAEEAALLLDEPDLGALVLEFAQSPAARRMLPVRAPKDGSAVAAP
ncbi:NUDIX hydrolase [Ancylobacter sp. TS-1]|nr:NUDIX hydrolase [Ancylobacter sp. TS-1]